MSRRAITAGVPLGYVAMVLAALARALARFPPVSDAGYGPVDVFQMALAFPWLFLFPFLGLFMEVWLAAVGGLINAALLWLYLRFVLGEPSA